MEVSLNILVQKLSLSSIASSIVLGTLECHWCHFFVLSLITVFRFEVCPTLHFYNFDLLLRTSLNPISSTEFTDYYV